MKGLLTLIVDILKVPSILVGLIAMIGLLVQKKPATDIVKGTIKTILGFLVLGGGAGLVVNSLAPMGSMFEQGFHVQGIVPNNEAIVSMALGLVMAIFPALAQPYIRKITGSDDVGFGHFSTIGYVLSGFVGTLVGKGSKSTEEMKLPKNLSFLRDSSISISLTMMIIYLILALVAGKGYVEKELSGGDNYLVFAVIQAITFAAGVYIILSGVRLVLAEIVPAFVGFSEKLVPNAKPALDCPIVFPYAPNAVLIGFLCSFLGGVIGLFMLGMLKWTLILPGVVPHFFCGATAGVFGNATGGRRGASIGAFANGLLLTFLPVILLPVLGNLGFANTTFSDADFVTVGIVLGNMAKHVSPAIVSGIIVGITAILVAFGFVPSKKSE